MPLRIGFDPTRGSAPAHTTVFELPGVGGLNPLPHLADPLPLVKIRPRGSRVSTPHLSFAEVGMLLDLHFRLMQFFVGGPCPDLPPLDPPLAGTTEKVAMRTSGLWDRPTAGKNLRLLKKFLGF